MQFRWEAYNVFNQVNWSTINTNAQFNPAGEQVNANFGQATASRPARIMQGAIRFTCLSPTCREQRIEDERVPARLCVCCVTALCC